MNVDSFKLGVVDTEHVYALNEHQHSPHGAGDTPEQDCEDTGCSFAQVEVVNAERAEEDSEKSCETARFSVRPGRKGVVVVVTGIGVLDRVQCVCNFRLDKTQHDYLCQNNARKHCERVDGRV